jgi:hypothetical protein
MFRVTMCPSPGEITVSMRHLVFVTLCAWLSSMQGGIPPCIPHSYPHRVTNIKCRIDTVISPDDAEHSRPKHVAKRNKHTKKNCAPSWPYLQDYTRIYGQQNIKYPLYTCMLLCFSMAAPSSATRYKSVTAQWKLCNKWHTTQFILLQVTTINHKQIKQYKCCIQKAHYFKHNVTSK